MDNIYSIIHKKNRGQRLAPIPTVTDEETFVIIKPLLKNANDVSVEKVTFDNETLYIKIKEFNNPSIDVKNRQSPNILLKLLKKNICEKSNHPILIFNIDIMKSKLLLLCRPLA